MPERLQPCLADFQKHTEAWIDRCREVWFGDRYGRLADAVGAGEYEESPEWYSYAINLIEDVARCAKEGKKQLKTAARSFRAPWPLVGRDRRGPPSPFPGGTAGGPLHGPGQGAELRGANWGAWKLTESVFLLRLRRE